MNRDNDIDQLFRDKLSDPEIPFNEMDWKQMEAKLDQQQKKRLVPVWLYGAGGIAAALIISLYWILVNPVSVDKRVIKDTLTNKKPGQQSVIPFSVPDSLNPAADSSQLQPDLKNGDMLAGNRAQPVMNNIARTESQLLEEWSGQPVWSVPSPLQVKMGTLQTIKVHPFVSPETDSSRLAEKANALAHSKDPAGRIDAVEIARSVKQKMENALQQNHEVIVSAMAAPDLSFAKSSKPSKVSSNVGMLATYAFGSKISVTSGAIYSRKFYNSGGTAPQSNNYSPGADWQVNADCNVLDIPLNVNYKIFSQKKLAISLNTGLSSYFMLKEKYQFITGQPGPSQQVSTLEINNQNQHLFGIANVSISFDHQISPSVSIGVQPFAKLPLTGIGYGKADLKSAGVSFSLNIGLFPAKKPGKYAAVQY
ncbi:hypothetical protein [Pedobacter cryoconitis]|uniref:Outer membrane protein beta-barrel domain-containing protein n=1 Tax=Pedobacter cryoconitis TaxID=188932 RepID=A0A7X0J461_9SPHI|nr:hypothetical protein [Pedobacter cryoconitis]MBB6500725.1 hypothetical protein [Pedobacter cryoconitis]